MRAHFITRSRWIGAAVLAFALIAVLVLLSGIFTGDAPAQDATATFLGFTNVTAKGRCAMFAITNTSGPNLALLVDSFDESNSGAWTNRALMSGATLTPQAHRWLSSFTGWRETLSAGDGFVFYVASPTTNAPWRIRFIAQQRDPSDSWRNIFGTATPNSTVLFAGRSNLGRRFFRYRVFRGRRYTFTSPEVVQ